MHHVFVFIVVLGKPIDFRIHRRDRLNKHLRLGTSRVYLLDDLPNIIGDDFTRNVFPNIVDPDELK